MLKELKRLRDIWLRLPGVTGLDFGYETKGGRVIVPKSTDPPSFKLRLHVEEKALMPEDVPPWQLFLLDGDVIEATYQTQHVLGAIRVQEANLKGRLEPLMGGTSVGNQRLSNTGTLGLVVWDRSDGRPCILSNWHVLARGPRILPGAPIYQPGPYDGATAQDRVALLKRWMFDERMDAALAELTGERPYASGVIWGQEEPVRGMLEEQELLLGQIVVKSGRTTRSTRGIIEGVMGAYLVDYGSSTRLLIDQIRIAPDPDERNGSLPPTYPVSQPGDSGAVWLYVSENRGVFAAALHFAGDSSGLGRFALATPMKTVAEELSFSVKPEYLLSQKELDAVKFTGARARAGEQPVGDPIGRGGSQPVGAPIGGGGAQPVGDPIGGGGSQPVGDPIGGGGSQPVGDPIGGGGAQPVGDPIGGGGAQPVGDPIGGGGGT